MRSTAKRAPPKKGVAPIFTFARRARKIIYIQDSFRNPLIANKSNWKRILRELGGKKLKGLRPSMEEHFWAEYNCDKTDPRVRCFFCFRAKSGYQFS